MENKKVSTLPPASDLVGSEVIAVIQEGASKRTNLDSLSAAILGKWRSQLTNGMVNPEMFGAPVEYSAVGDDTSAVAQSIQAAMTEGLNVSLNRMYRCGDISISTSSAANRGLMIKGRAGEDFKRQRASSVGFELLDTGQQFLLKIAAVTGSAMDNFRLEDLVISGADKAVVTSLFWIANISQASCLNTSFRRVKGSLVAMNKAEDFNFINCRFGLAGDSSGKPAVYFSDAPGSQPDPLDRIGSNAVRFIASRFEFIDGPHLGIEAGKTNAWASSIFIDHSKFEAGSISSHDTAVPYGNDRAAFPIIDARGGLENRVSFKFTECLFSRADTTNCSSVFAIGDCDDFVARGNQYSCGAGDTVNLFDISDISGNPVNAKNVIIEDSNLRVYDDNNAEQVALTFTNKSRFPVKYVPPVSRRHNAANEIVTRNTLNLLYASYAASMDASVSSVHCISDPDVVTDPCLSPNKSVIAANGGSNDRLVVLAPIDLQPMKMGFSQGLGCRIRLWLRVKKAGNVDTAAICITHGTSPVTDLTIYISETVWAWKYIDLDLPSLGDALRVRNSATNNADHIIYLDAIRVEYIDFIEKTFTYNPSNLVNGTSAVQTFTLEGATVGDYVEVFPPSSYTGGMQGVSYRADITSADTVSLYLNNTTGGDIDFPSGSWLFKCHKRNGLR